MGLLDQAVFVSSKQVNAVTLNFVKILVYAKFMRFLGSAAGTINQAAVNSIINSSSSNVAPNNQV